MAATDLARNETLAVFGKVNTAPNPPRGYDDGRRLYMQVYHLPNQLARARARVRQLEAQAKRLGMHDLLEGAN